jgi:uncharacterized protein with gpF-like domain
MVCQQTMRESMGLLRRLSGLVQSASELALNDSEEADVFVGGPRRRLGRRSIFEPTPRSLAAYEAVLAEKVALIDRLPAKYRREAQQLVWSAVLEGYDDAALARDLQDRFGLSPERARLIARTQCTMARAVIENVHRMELGLTEAVWICSKKHASEPAHLVLNGRRYPVKTGVTLNGKSIWPGSEPGCYCASVIAHADDKG